ncbi:SDR family oxidoreductase [Actinoplanes sp. LDG1-06]|uniref:SDR family oxidoreductase n=1 Tax=Paractinoplanes ovalisporus TaxID=2810368 RepID=A0ABS2AHH2_9ACTN|nr:SDR family oxidoreductase [Actinoplanes ovalisporus]MBM2619303.1 SDR family oxidoreductase [Actinoplanes ovalisporus]
MSSSKPLDGRVAVVTGASSGIGAATAVRLAADGARVALLARRADRLAEVAATIGDAALPLTVDVTDPSALDAAAKTVEAEFGPADLVVANAGVMLVAPFAEGRRDEWATMLSLNVMGVLDTARVFLPQLLTAADAGGNADLVIVSSLGARQFSPGFGVYSVTKAGVSALAASLRAEFADRGLRVTNVEPGVTDSELGDRILHDEWRTMLAEHKAQMNALSAADIADAIADATARSRNVHIRELIVHPLS